MKRAKTNVNHIEQARADITFNGKKAIMTLDWDKPSRFYIHVRGMGVNKVIAEQQDPRAILMDWTRSMKKYGGELVARTPKQQELIQKQHQLAASFRDSRSRFFSPEFLRELRKAYLKDIRYGKKMTPKNLLAGSGVQAMGEPMKIGNEKELQQALANAKWPKPRRMFTPRTMDQEWTDRGTLVATKTTVYARKGSKKVVSESIMVNEDYLGKGPKESQGASGDKSSATRQAANPQELKEMESILKKYGYDPKDAKKLQQEGIGPEELKNRARIPGKGVGTLEYTHNLKRKGNATQQWASMRDAKDSGYKTYFDKKLKEWGIKSPADLDDAKKKKFFADVDQGWKSQDEKKGARQAAPDQGSALRKQLKKLAPAAKTAEKLMKRFDKIFGGRSINSSDLESLLKQLHALFVPVRALAEGWLQYAQAHPGQQQDWEAKLLHQNMERRKDLQRLPPIKELYNPNVGEGPTRKSPWLPAWEMARNLSGAIQSYLKACGALAEMIGQ